MRQKRKHFGHILYFWEYFLKEFDHILIILAFGRPPVRRIRATTMDNNAQTSLRGKRGAELPLGRRYAMAVEMVMARTINVFSIPIFFSTLFCPWERVEIRPFLGRLIFFQPLTHAGSCIWEKNKNRDPAKKKTPRISRNKTPTLPFHG